MKKIALNQNKFVLVDDVDFDWLNQWKWFFKLGYAIRNEGDIRGNKKRKTIIMHRLILQAPKGIEVDHKNMDGLDNQRQNLRLANHSQNNLNKLSYKNSSSKYKGVSWDKFRKKWRANITVNNIDKFIGRFKTAIAAAKAYDLKAKELHGEFARLNFI